MALRLHAIKILLLLFLHSHLFIQIKKMKKLNFTLFLVFCIVFIQNSFASTEAKTSQLNEVEKVIQSEANKNEFIKEMNGDLSNYWKSLGALSFNDVNAPTLYHLLSNSKSRPQAPSTIHTGVLPLPFSKKEYLGWVYWESTSDRAPIKKNEYHKILNAQISFGIFNKNEFGYFELKKGLKPLLNFNLGDSTELSSFDFAPYELGKLGRAIGVRTTIHSCGAGGSICSNEDLRLFSINTSSVQEILHSPIGYFAVYAGDWHKDGTRDHFTEELPGILTVDNRYNQNGIPKVIIKALYRKQWLMKEFTIAKTAQGQYHYKSTNAEIFPLVVRYQTFDDLNTQLKAKKTGNPPILQSH